MSTSTCTICNGSDAKYCSLCHSISYCSPECQKLDWPLHKTICKTFTALDSRPSPSHKLAILFPVDSKHPQLIWIKCERHVDDEDGIAFEMPITQPILETENLDPKYLDVPESKPINRSVLRGFRLSHTVKVICRETFLIDGSTSNVCVRHTTRGQMTHDWRGPIVAMRQPGTATDPLIHEDIRAADLRVAVDYFLSYGKGS
jgi:hypothetical protein